MPKYIYSNCDDCTPFEVLPNKNEPDLTGCTNQLITSNEQLTDKIATLEAQVKELKLEVKARDRVMGKADRWDGECSICIHQYGQPCVDDIEVCFNGMIAFAKAEIKKEQRDADSAQM